MPSATIEQGFEYGLWWSRLTLDLINSTSRKLDPRARSHLLTAIQHLKEGAKFAEPEQDQVVVEVSHA